MTARFIRRVAVAGMVAMASASVWAQAANYVVREGMDYGYTVAVSNDGRSAGQVSESVMMFRYAGKRGDRYQVHSTGGVSSFAMECSRPCQVIKIISFVDQDYMRQMTSVEYVTAKPGSVGFAVFEDVFNGKLNQYGMSRGSKRYQVWVEEKRGFREYPITVDGGGKTP